MLHKKELYEVSRWWKELDLISKLSYARDRVVECYFWTLGVYFEPQYSRARVMLAKTIAMISIIDDTYDSYGTVDELAIFTDAIESTYYLLATTSFIGMESVPKEAFDWLMKKPKIQVANVTICRVVDDIATYEIEKKRGQTATGIECYMNEYGVCEEEAMREFSNIAESAWKDINEEFVKENAVPRETMKRVVNLARLIDVVYKHNQDGYTHRRKC
ncbi:Vetispiradiene synthase 1 [Sesamum angolense]|uniref:Vetispiradiene synthase 1 n=1 Tax=Sesamum angolense TaxID=2727404 RepID=A0AAE1T117_9LAMI|nr:Vetispiradiene synthase 1 [Sesamum angolense]